MKNLVFASNNANKISELKAVCPPQYNIISLKDAGIIKEIEEPFFTLAENAKEKCRVIYELTGSDCFAEDTGLEVVALNGAPGVHSARYAGEERSDLNNINKLLNELKKYDDRLAQFRTIICYVKNGVYQYFEGICEGKIAELPAGNNGFGYDPVFIPNGFNATFAQMEKTEKVLISHRKRAFEKLFLYLTTI